MARIQNFPPESDLLATLAADKRLQSPDALVFLPNHRALERFKRLMMERGGYLPQMQLLGEMDEVWLMQQATMQGTLDELLSIPEAADDHLCCLQLAVALSQSSGLRGQYVFEQYMQMAQAIWQVFETLEREGKTVLALKQLSQTDLSDHWRERIDLLRFAADWWHDMQTKQQIVSATQRRYRQAVWLTDYWQKAPPETPVVIAGSTGSQASTLRLMQAALHLPQGEVWLQGLDEEVIQQELLPSHPQFLFQRLMQALPDVPLETLPTGERSAGIYEAFRVMHPVEAPSGVTMLNARDEEAEAALAALLAREALEQSEQVVAIITQQPERIRRLQAALKRYGVNADSAVGEAITHLPEVRLWLLIWQAMCEPKNSIIWLALMKQAGLRDMTEAFERNAIRGKRSTLTVAERIYRYTHRDGLKADSIDTLTNFLLAMQPLLSQLDHEAPASQLFASHYAAFQALMPHAPNPEILEVFERLKRVFEKLGECTLEEYQHMTEHLLAQQKHFPERQNLSRVQLFSTIEARLMRADRVVLCGLNEGDWPQGTAHSSWLHPLLAQRLDLPDAQRSIGLSAHDFVTLSGMAQELFWIRPQRADGADQLPSRWLERFAFQDMPSHYNLWLNQQDEQHILQTNYPPAPTPPLEARPKEMSITSLTLLLRNPYAAYAKLVLKLRQLDPIDRTADVSLRGDMVHQVMEALCNALNNGAPLTVDTYYQVAEEVLSKQNDPLVKLQWSPRIMAMAEAVMAEEVERRADDTQVQAEQTREVMLGNVRIEGRIDRLESRTEAFAIIDYKAGQVPSKADVEAGFEPQLPMLGAMLTTHCYEMAYWKLGNLNVPITKTSFKDADALIDFYREGVNALLTSYQTQLQKAYYVSPQPSKAPRYNDYAHLAREENWTIEKSA